jgi:predicted acyl esterase
MKPMTRISFLALLALLAAMALSQPSVAQSTPANPGLPSETPAQFTPITDKWDYVRSEVMIPMRDGVKLHTVILVPRSAT